MPMSQQRYFATCGRGIEPVLAGELDRLGAAAITPGRGGVHFGGDRALLYRANLWLRTAVRVLWPVLEAPVTTPDDLYAAVQTIDWSRWLTPRHTLAVDCNVRDSAITHSQYAARRVKDAICDQFVSRVGSRPSVDPVEPMLGFNLHIYRNQATLSLDSSGMSLHKRGYRPVQTRAPLNEALAAAILLRTGWKPDTPLIDPLCGSGTLPIEAAWMALNRPPGLTRKRFGFMGWMDYDIALWADLRDQARRGVGKALPAPITGSDQRGDAVASAINNAKAAGIGHLLRFSKRELRDLSLPEGTAGVVVCNPPYGERIGDEKSLVGLYRLLGEVFRARAPGWRMWVFTGNARLAGEIGLDPIEEVPLFNGKIPCRLLAYDNEPRAK
jgi:putative N6-adenine-specific DNA methylase